jgi:hypothetical protein
MTDKIKHFEDLWVDAENLSKEVYKNSSIENLLKSISDLLNEYKETNSSELPEEVKKSLKNRYIGEITFILTSISEKENIDVYGALKNEMTLNK